MSCGNTSTRLPRPNKAPRRIRHFLLGAYRLALIAAAFAALSMTGPDGAETTDRDELLDGARRDFPQTVALGNPEDGFFPLLDQEDAILGWVTSSFPHAARIQGYTGPSELLIVLDPARRVRAVSLLKSADTAGHVDKVRDDPRFWEQWSGKGESRLSVLETPAIVSGATLTSEAIARGVAARFGATGLDQWFTRGLDPESVSRWFPEVDRVEPSGEPGVSRVLAEERVLGSVLRSSRMEVSARGFNGASDVLVALSPDGSQVLGVGLLDSRDNEPYVGDVKEELIYADGFAGMSVEEILADDAPDNLLVSGASVTADAVITTVSEMLRRHQTEDEPRSIPWAGLAAFGWIGAGLAAGLSKRGSKRRARLLFACVSVAAGLTLGWMVGQDQLVGWARHGVDSATGLTLLTLTAVALVAPVLTGRNVYCSAICPHGAAQTLAGQATRRRFAIPAPWRRGLQRLPWLTLVAIWGLALAGSGLPFANAEPFEIWSLGFHAILPATIFTAGLLAAFFLPQAYCHYGCPTGALLKFLTHSPGRFTRRDSIAGLLVAAAWCYVLIS